MNDSQWIRIYKFKIKRRWEDVCRLVDDMVGSVGVLQGVESVCFSFKSSMSHDIEIRFLAHRDMCDDQCKDRPTFNFKYNLRWIRKFAC